VQLWGVTPANHYPAESKNEKFMRFHVGDGLDDDAEDGFGDDDGGAIDAGEAFDL
jgi:hypothetical protein